MIMKMKAWKRAGLAALCLGAFPFCASAAPAEWAVDGDINAIALSPAGDVVYIGGFFNQIEPFTGAAVPLDPAGHPQASFSKIASDGLVNVVIPDGTGGWFVGGNFFSVGGGLEHHSLAHLLADGSVDSGWDTGTDS